MMLIDYVPNEKLIFIPLSWCLRLLRTTTLNIEIKRNLCNHHLCCIRDQIVLAKGITIRGLCMLNWRTEYELHSLCTSAAAPLFVVHGLYLSRAHSATFIMILNVYHRPCMKTHYLRNNKCVPVCNV